jgi:penicillin-binding protein 1C
MKPIRFLRARSRREIILLALVIPALLLAGFAYFWILHDLPSVDDLEAGLALPSTRIYDRNGKLLYEILPPEQGRNVAVPLDEIPQHCINAAIATEDANYYRHPGVDVVGIARALVINLRGGEVLAGGSTITQQTARLLLMDPEQRLERTLRRKLRESVLAIRLQNAYSKDEVLALYLNQNYFGNLAYGIEAAARTYFGKAAQELSLAECALLAGLAQNAAAYDPLTRPDRAKARQEIVLSLMAQNGYITAAEVTAAQQDELQYAAVPFPIEAPHFVMAVWRQLERGYPEHIYGGGLEVITTVDLDWQRDAQRIVNLQLDYLNDPPPGTRIPANARNAAVVAIDPFTGQVLTMLGSPDYFDQRIDGAVNAALALRQPGSALKPFTYAAAMNPALDDPFTAATMILDVKTPFVTRRLESYTPANYGLAEHGPVLAREALASSYNIPAVVTLEHIGLQPLIDLLNNAGVSTLVRSDIDLAVTLGGGEVRLLDLVQAYSIFANGGFRVEPSMILQVSTRDGETLYEWQPPRLENRVLDERIAYIITHILSDPQARIPGFGRSSPMNIGRTAAAKTGTTTDFRDNWIVGYTPNLVTGVWVGNANNTPMIEVTGITGAGPIWNAFMRRVLRGQPELEFPRPEGILETEVCALSGLLPTRACTHRHMELFLPGTVPTREDDFHQVFEIDIQTGLLANEDTPLERRREQVFIVLPQEARDWAVRNGIRQPPPGAISQVTDRREDVRLLQPDPFSIFQLSPMIPPESQRIRLTAATPPGTQSVTYHLNERRLDIVAEAPWSLWWQLEPGDYTLTATATLEDGTEESSAPLYFRVTEYDGPQSRTVEDGPPIPPADSGP